MKKYLAVALLMATAPSFAADVGVSVSIGQPGFYGQIDIGNQYPRPALIYNQPVIIQQTRVVRQPLYLHVPPGHAKHWRKHCRQYGACGAPVYFVQDNWYNTVYAPEYRKHGDRRGYDQRGEHRDHEDRGEHRGHGNNDHGNGHGRKD